MAIRPNNEERGFGADRERQREISNESGRTARASGGDSAARSDGGAESGSSPRRSNRGFASMDRTKQREIASKGGRAAHQKGTAHEFDSSEARAAGRKGGVTVSRNREHVAPIVPRDFSPTVEVPPSRVERPTPATRSASRAIARSGSPRTPAVLASTGAGRAPRARAATRSVASVAPRAPTNATSSVRKSADRSRSRGDHAFAEETETARR
jgi:uncharacterized protein